MEKRVLSFLLVLGLVFSMLPGTALAAGTSGNTATNGNPLNATWYLDESGKVLTLRGTREMGNGHLTGSSTVETVIIEEGITSIGNDAFDGFKLLSHVTLPQSITAIGQSAFASCESLTELILPDAVSSIGPRAFDRCEKLTGITIPANVKEISENTFRECYELERVTIPNGVLSIRNSAFYNCSKLTDITIPDSVTSIGESAFYDCDLLDIEIPSKVNQIGKNAFGFTALQTATIPSGVTLIDEITFQYCRKLSSITIPSSVGRIADFAFSGCDGLKDVYFKGSQTQWEQVEIGRSNDYLTSATIHFLGEEAKTYSLRFYPNGGTGKLPEPAFYKAGEVITLSVAPSREGYIFAGWSDGQKTYQSGERFTMPEKNVTLTAQWTPYTPPVYPMLSYDLKGGTGTLPGATPYAAGTTVKISDVIPIHDDVFLGWYCVDRPDQVYLPGDSFTMPDHDVVLGAVWGGRIPILEYNLNGGTGKNIPRPENKTHGEMVIVTMSIPELEGYRFIGWSDKKEGGTKLYSPGDFFNMPNMDTVLFAQWKKLYSLSFNANGGTGTVPEPALYIEGELVTLPAALTKEGLEFGGWSDGLRTYSASGQFSMPGNDLILVAQWKNPVTDLINADRVFLKQPKDDVTCTLVSATMMLRRAAIINEWPDWGLITVDDVKQYAWGSSLKWNFKYRGISVVTQGLSSAGCITTEQKMDKFISLLNAHPEGIVIYNHSMPHAVLLTDYDSTTNTFYCADPAEHITAGRIPLEKCSIVGNTQSEVISAINQIWFITGGVDLRSIIQSDLSLHCPVEMRIVFKDEALDSMGVMGEISNSYATMTATGSGANRNIFVTVPGGVSFGDDTSVEFVGLDAGSMTFTIKHHYTDGTTETQILQNVPVTNSTTGIASILPQTTVLLKLKDKADSKQTVWAANPGETATEPSSNFGNVADLIPTPSTPSQPSESNSSSGGLSSGTNSYLVSVSANISHGTIRINPSQAKKGDIVTITVNPEKGYELNKLTVTDSKGKELELTDKDGGKYTFTMPASAVKVEAVFVLAEIPWTNPFSDVSNDDWHYEAVRFVQERGLMNGYSDSRFGPNEPLSRAQLAQILFNKAGRPVVNYLLDFSDVAGEAWYTEAIRWATSQGIVGGYGNGMFGPNDPITREQLAVMLWRYSGSPAATNKDLHFTDADKASGYALEALRWAVGNGILNGYGDGRLGPQGQATRAQVAQMLKNYLESYQ